MVDGGGGGGAGSGNHFLLSVYIHSQCWSLDGVQTQYSVMGLHTPWPDTPGTLPVTDEDWSIDSFWTHSNSFCFYRNSIFIQRLISSRLIPAIHDGWKDKERRSVSSEGEKPNQWHAYSKNLSTHKMIRLHNTKEQALKDALLKQINKKKKLQPPEIFDTHVLKGKYSHLEGSTCQRISNKIGNNHKHTLQRPTWLHCARHAVDL